MAKNLDSTYVSQAAAVLILSPSMLLNDGIWKGRLEQNFKNIIAAVSA